MIRRAKAKACTRFFKNMLEFYTCFLTNVMDRVVTTVMQNFIVPEIFYHDTLFQAMLSMVELYCMYFCIWEVLL